MFSAVSVDGLDEDEIEHIKGMIELLKKHGNTNIHLRIGDIMEPKLFLPKSFEDLQATFGNSADAKLMEFMEPLTKIEQQIEYLCNSITSSGKLAFLLGPQGSGKSSFVHSLSWQPHISVGSLYEIDGAACSKLDALYDGITKLSPDDSLSGIGKATLILINYLEDFHGFDEGDIKSFFRRLNSYLRQNRVLIIWPVTQKSEVDKMLDYSSKVSGTMFVRGNEVINFSGPDPCHYIDIAKRTIQVVNTGHEIEDFQLTHDDFEETLNSFKTSTVFKEHTIRNYYELIEARWQDNSGYIDSIKKKIPKPFEVWFVFVYKDAEDKIASFTRKTKSIDSYWSVIPDKLHEYITDSQKEADWTATRLQLALNGAIKTRIMYMQTNALISILASYSTSEKLKSIIESNSVPERWCKKSTAQETFSNSPVYRQLKGILHNYGRTKGSPTRKALETADPIYAKLVDWISKTGTDKEFNKCVASILRDFGFTAYAEKEHPGIPNIYPDVLIETEDKYVSIEFHYTNNSALYIIAGYVLNKLDTYMKQLEKLFGYKKAD